MRVWQETARAEHSSPGPSPDPPFKSLLSDPCASAPGSRVIRVPFFFFPSSLGPAMMSLSAFPERTAMSTPSADDFLRIGPRVRVLPIIHGSGDFAVCVRDELLARPYDCLAVPLPPSFQRQVEAAIERLPAVAAVVQKDAEGDGFSYVPIDPCQGVIAGLRTARGERIARAFIDRETPHFEPNPGHFPDPYALKRVSAEGFAAAVLPAIPPPGEGQHAERI